ncbi:YfjI family protein [Halomonas sp. GXIMD04776]|uniref:YfjI family protein n=1 Tax=Halomonas sp. GXIMD04776 TaxID=3415605 RepID=UPI003C90B6B1
MNMLEQLNRPASVTPDPKPLPDSLPPVPAFEPEMLPVDLCDYVMDVAQRTQCPPEYCAIAALVLLSGLAGHKVRLRPKQHDDWEIVIVLWGLLIGDPSMMKTPAIKAMRFALDAIEADLRRDFENAQAEHEADAELHELAKAAAKKQAKGFADKGDLQAAKDVLMNVDELAPPKAPQRLTMNDATVEKAGELMNESEHHLTIVRDEMAGLLSKMQQEEYAADRAFYLECFNGDSRFTYDRIGRGTVAIERCALNLIGGIQPSKLAPIVRGALKGTANDGLIQRFQLAVWPDPVRHWEWIDRSPDPRAKERYAQTFYRLHSLDLGTDEDGNPPAWRFTEIAQGHFIEWMTELNRECRSGRLSPLLAEHLMKLPKTVGSLALLFALIDGEHGSVSETSLLRALEWADFLTQHTERLYSAASNRDVEGARLILKRRAKLPQPFKARQVQQRGWAGLDTSEAVQSALDLLDEHGYLTAMETPTAGRPRTDYWWHPDFIPQEVA